MSLVEGPEGSGLGDAEFEPVTLPDDFVIPKPQRDTGGRFSARKPAGDKADAVRKKPTVRVPNRKGQFVEPLTALYMGLGGVLLPFDPVCANAVLTSASNCAEVWDELAYTNEAVRRFLWSLTQVSTSTKLFVAHMPIFMAVFMHHVPAAQKMMGAMGEKFAESVAEQMRENGSASDEG